MKGCAEEGRLHAEVPLCTAWIMNIIDIRNYLTHRKINVLETTPEMVYFTEVRKDDGRLFLFVIEYDMDTKMERTLINYSVDDAQFLPRCHMFGRTILVVYENGRDEFWVYKIDKRTGEEFYSGQFNCIGDFHSCFLLDQDRILVYTTPNKETAHLFSAYKQATGCDRIVYLYNLETEEKNLIKNDVLCRSRYEYLHTYHHSGNTHLLIADCSCTEEEKEEAFLESEKQWHSVKTVEDNIWTIPYATLFLSVERGDIDYPLNHIAHSGNESWARFMGMDSTNIYYRCKDFKTGIETMFSHDKLNDEKKTVGEIDHNDIPENVHFIYDNRNTKVYRLSDGEYAFTIEGVMHSALKASRVEKKLGEFFACMEDRYIICSFGLGEDEDQQVYEYKYTSLYDVRTDYSECVQGNCTISGNNLILY